MVLSMAPETALHLLQLNLETGSALHNVLEKDSRLRQGQPSSQGLVLALSDEAKQTAETRASA